MDEAEVFAVMKHVIIEVLPELAHHPIKRRL